MGLPSAAQGRHQATSPTGTQPLRRRSSSASMASSSAWGMGTTTATLVPSNVSTMPLRTTQRVIRNDASTCGAQNPLAFEKLRELLMMHYATRTRAAAQIGEVETQAIINSVVAKIAERFGSIGGGSR